MKNRSIKISDVCDLNLSSISSNDIPAEIYYLDTGNITRNIINKLKHLIHSKDSYPSRAQRKVKHNTIIYSTVRPNQEHFGILKNPKDNLIVSTGFATIDVNDSEIDPTFLYYILTQKPYTSYLHTIAENSVSSYPSISPDDIGNLEFDIPKSKITQENIAKVLSDIDSKIVLNIQINNELEAMLKSLYGYWFIQFDFPNDNGQPYKSTGGKMVYNSDIKSEIPEGWSVIAIDDWIEKDKNGDWGEETAIGNYTQKVSCIRGADINGLNGIGELKSPTRFILENNSNRILESHDLIVEISGGSPTQSTGRLAFVIDETLERFDNPIICSNFCKAVTLKEPKYLYNFVYQWNRLYDFGVLFGWEGKTSGIKNLLFENFVSNQKVVFPKPEIVEKFYDIAKSAHIKKQKNLLENQKLAELRDWLLPMLMNGQITVGEAEEKFNMAAEPQAVYKKG
nr:restriction endonuclease subunit S [uncultured Carboxylicivirga sp.]